MGPSLAQRWACRSVLSADDSTSEGTTSTGFRVRPGGTKAAKETQRVEKVGEKAALVQAKAAEIMDEATLRKAASLEYHNMILLFSAPMENLTTPEAHEYITLLRQEELDKLRRRRADAAALESREREGREADAAREREQAASKAREDEETLTQMRQAGEHFGGDADGESWAEEQAPPEEEQAAPDRDVVELDESDDEHEALIIHLETNCDTVETWTPIDDNRESWDDLEHVTLEMPTTWNVVISTPNSQDPNAQEDLGLYLGLDLGVYTDERFYR